MNEMKVIDEPRERRLREACAELDARLRAGEPCRAEEFLANAGDLASDPEFAIELIYAEVAARDRRGEQLRPDDWYERFPQWRDSLARLFELHQLVGDTERPGSGSPTDTPAGRPHPLADDSNLVGTRIGQYELLEEIGRGGMGVVFKARQLGLDRIVAIKMVLGFQATWQMRTRFRQEAETVARLHHPNIVQIYEVGEQNGCAFLSMEFVEGNSLDRELAQSPRPARAAAELVETLARAMHYAHQLGIVHRDLKPANVLLTGDGVPKITDFGLAKLVNPSPSPSTDCAAVAAGTTGGDLTATGQILGTPSYMAPEQTTGKSGQIAPAVDVYALGAILYEALCGRAPFRGETPLDTLEQVRSHDPLPPSRLQPKLPRDLETICLKCLAKEPHRRYATAERLADDLRSFLAGRSIAARPFGPVERAWRWGRRNPWNAGLIAAVLLVSTVGTIVATLFAVDAREQKRLADEKAQDAWIKQTEATAARDEKEQARAAAEGQRVRAEKAEALAMERLEEVTREKQRADEESRIAQAVNDFLQQDLLQQADSAVQSAYGYAAEPNLTVRRALDRAAARIGDRFQDQPLVEAGIRQSIGVAYRGIGNPEAGLPHLERARALRSAHLGPDHRQTLTCTIELAYVYKETGRIDQALPLLEQALEKLNDVLGPDHSTTLTTASNLALTYADAGRLAQARSMFEQVLAKLRETLGPDHPRTLLTMNSLAWTYQAAGQLNQALPLFEQALAQQNETLPPDHPETLQTMNNLGVAYIEADRIAEAVPLLEQVLAKRQETLGPDHPLTLLSMHNLGRAYLDADRLTEAQPLLEQSLAKQKEVLYPNHPHTLQSMHDLALVYWSLNKRDQSIPLFEEVIERRTSKLGVQHPDTLRAMVHLGDKYRQSGRLPAALPLLEQSLAKQQEVLGPDHHDTLESMHSLARAYQADGRLAEALPLFEQSLAKLRELHGPDHSHTLVNMNNLAALYWSMKRLDRSIPLFEEAVARFTSKLGADHPKTLRALANLGVNYRDAGRLDEALPLLERAHRQGRQHAELAWVGQSLAAAYVKAGKNVEVIALVPELIATARQKHTPGSPELASALTEYGSLLVQAEAFADAEPILQECLAIRQSQHPDAWTTFSTQSMLGRARLGQREHAAAEPLLVQGYEGMKERAARIPAKYAERVTDALESLVQLYDDWGKPDEAARWRAELDRVREQLRTNFPKPDSR